MMNKSLVEIFAGEKVKMVCFFCEQAQCCCPNELKDIVDDLASLENFVILAEEKHALTRFLIPPQFVLGRIIYVILGGRQNFRIAFLGSSMITYCIFHDLPGIFLFPPHAWPFIHSLRFVYLAGISVYMFRREAQIELDTQRETNLFNARSKYLNRLNAMPDKPPAVQSAIDHLNQGFFVSKGKTTKKIKAEEFKQSSTIKQRLAGLSPSPYWIFYTKFKNASTAIYHKTNCVIL